MRIMLALFTSGLILCPRLPAQAGPREDVVSATQAWVDAMSSRDVDRVVALYDPEAILWGTVSPVLRDNPAAIRDYFKGLPGMPAEFKGVIGEQRVRVYGETAINTGTPTTQLARFSFVYRNRDGRWLIVDHHSSSMPAPPQ